MMNFNDKKTKRIIAGIIVGVLVLSMVLPLALSYII